MIQLTEEMRKLLENVDIPANPDACTKLMFTLEADVAANGWDQDHIMYMVVGDLNDPYFIRHPVTVLHHPAAHLQALWDHGMRFTPEVHGIAFATETWSHLDFEDVARLKPEMITQMQAALGAVFPHLSEEERLREVEKGYYTLLERLPTPSEMPDELRKEGRNVVLTFRNGTTLGVMRNRDAEPLLMDPTPWDLAKRARVPKFIHQMLNDQRPELTPGENLWKKDLES